MSEQGYSFERRILNWCARICFLLVIATICMAMVMQAAAGTVAYWDFNSPSPDTNDITGTFAPAIGVGTAGVINASYAFRESTVDLDTESLDNSCLRMSGFPAATVSNRTAGVEFRFSTVGHTNISLQYDHNNNPSGSRYYRVQYTPNGTDWIDHLKVTNAYAGWFIYTVDFQSVTAANNNPNFGVRLVSEFESTATGSGTNAYIASQEPAIYGAGGTFWVDRVTFTSRTNRTEAFNLKIGITGETVKISWPSEDGRLQQAESLVASSWNWVAQAKSISNGISSVSLPVGASPQYFRVRHGTFRVMSYNIHHGEGTDGVLNLSRIANVILTQSPDIVGLQEVDRNTVRSGGVDQMAELGRLTGMYHFFGKNRDYGGGDYGMGVLSKFPILSQQHVLYDLENTTLEQRGVNVTQLNPGGSDIYFLNTHLDHTTPDSERLHQINQLGVLAQSYPSEKLLFCGDFNFQPDDACYISMAQEFMDAWPRAGQGVGFTFPSTTPNRRIDFFWTKTPALTPVRAWVAPQSPASDHLPLVMDFLLP